MVTFVLVLSHKTKQGLDMKVISVDNLQIGMVVIRIMIMALDGRIVVLSILISVGSGLLTSLHLSFQVSNMIGVLFAVVEGISLAVVSVD